MLNQEVHKNLRRNKPGIHVDRIEKLSPNYKRPPGFTLLPTLLSASMQNKSLDKSARQQLDKSPQKYSASKSSTPLPSTKSSVHSKLSPKNIMLR